MKNKKWIFSVSVLLVLVVFTLAACAQPTTGPMKAATWRYHAPMWTATTWPIEHSKWFSEEVGKRTGGQLKVEFYSGGTLAYKPQEIVSPVKDGLLEMADMTPGVIGGPLPAMTVQDMPFLFNDIPEFRKGIDFVFSDATRKELEDKYNLVVLMVYGYGARHIVSDKPIKTLDDFKGMKIRATATGEQLALKAAGATPLVIPWGETYEAKQRGTIDGVLTAARAFADAKFWEVAKYINVLNLAYSSTFTAVNKGIFRALPQDVQQTVIQIGKEAQERAWNDLPKLDGGSIDELASKGMTVNRVPEDVRAKIREMVVPGWYEMADKAGPGARPALDSLRKMLGR